MKKIKVKRHQVCVNCGLEWNISVKANVPRSGYICPICRGRKVHNENR